jgi:hypothetical protein
MNNVTEKIRKLLALGTSTNEFEAQRALCKARELAIEAGIDLAQVEVFKEQKQESIDKKDIECGKRFSICQRFVNYIIQKHFGCEVINSGCRSGGRSVIFVGSTSDIEIATYVHTFLNREMPNLWYQYREKTGCDLKNRNSFFFGCWKGLDEKLTKTKQETVAAKMDSIKAEKGADFAQKLNQNYSIVLVTEEQRRKQALKGFFPKLSYRRAKSESIASFDTLAAGKAAGHSISLNRALGGQLGLES